MFAADLPESAARVVCATQKPVHNSVFAATIDSPAWKTIPSWFCFSPGPCAEPDLERFYAKRMGAKTSEIDASHVRVHLASEGCGCVLIEQAATATATVSNDSLKAILRCGDSATSFTICRLTAGRIIRECPALLLVVLSPLVELTPTFFERQTSPANGRHRQCCR